MNSKLISKKHNILAGSILENGSLVAFPKKTVYGLGANALDNGSYKNLHGLNFPSQTFLSIVSQVYVWKPRAEYPGMRRILGLLK